MKMRLIDADALKEAVNKKKVVGRFNTIMLIDNAPIVPLPDLKDGYKQAIIDGKTNYSRPQGEWINHRNDNGHNIADCSLCGKATQWHDEDEDGIPRYCWYCGANMKGEEK